MTDVKILFNDGAAYERYMGQWSKLVGDAFLEWVAPKPGLKWLDVGCGNGAFTEMILARCAPASVEGIDPSDAQLAFARENAGLRAVKFSKADAMALPFADDAFDAAVMPLVIFFVPDPARGVAEMARVVGSGGLVTAYAWDLAGGGFPYQIVQDEMRAEGLPVGIPPNPGAANLETLRELWTNAGLTDIQTRVINVQRTFADFNDYWMTVLKGPSLGPGLSSLPADKSADLQAKLKTLLRPDASGRFTCQARAHAVKARA